MTHTTATAGLALVLCGTLAVLTQSSAVANVSAGPTANATLIDAEGRTVGQAHLEQGPHGVLLKLELKSATPGTHSLHVHDTGRCERPTFDSAGEHFNPTHREHGFLNPGGPHAGDLPNIEVPASAHVALEFFLNDVTIAPGPRSVADANGSAIVMHAGPDNHTTAPAGAAAHRVACGPIVRTGTDTR